MLKAEAAYLRSRDWASPREIASRGSSRLAIVHFARTAGTRIPTRCPRQMLRADCKRRACVRRECAQQLARPLTSPDQMHARHSPSLKYRALY
eukprot:5549029-Pleurochrysis_carterae.AAC.3